MKIRKILILFISLLFIVSCSSDKSDNALSGNDDCIDKEFRSKITIDTVIQMPVNVNIPLIGRVESIPDNVIGFVSLINGIISNTYFSLGDVVKKGQLLAEIRSPELSSMYAEKSKFESQIKVAERRLNSVKNMYKDGILSEKELIEAQSELDILKADLERVKSVLSLYSASAERGVFQIKAPGAGIITEKSITPGMQVVAESESLFTISELRKVWVTVNVYAGNVTQIKEGMDVEIKTISYPDEIFYGKISAMSQIFDVEEKVIKARIVMDNSDYRLKPGMLVDVKAINEKGISAPVIPVEALIFDNNQNFVLVYHDDCNVEIRNITLLTKSGNSIFISDGLEVNERIITLNHLIVYEKLKSLKD